MGENCVQDQHFPTLPINLKNPTNNEGEGGDDSRSDPMNIPVAADFYMVADTIKDQCLT